MAHAQRLLLIDDDARLTGMVGDYLRGAVVAGRAGPLPSGLRSRGPRGGPCRSQGATPQASWGCHFLAGAPCSC
jgi:hypothetical protein